MMFWGIVGVILLVVLLAAWRVQRKGTRSHIDTAKADFANDAAAGYAEGARNRLRNGGPL